MYPGYCISKDYAAKNKHYNVYGWVWPNTDKYTLLAKDVHLSEANKMKNSWMSKSSNHDAVVVDNTNEVEMMSVVA